MEPRRPRIAIDARYLSHGLVGGVHTYLHNLALALLDVDAGLDLVFWIDEKAPFDLRDRAGGFETRVLPWRNPLSSILNDARIGAAMARDGADVAHFPANYGFAPAGLPTVLTMHDAINLLPLHEIIRGHRKSPKTIVLMTYLHVLTTRAARRNPWVVTVSDYSRTELLRRAPLDPARLRVMYQAADPAFQPLDEACLAGPRSRLGLKARVILADAIKNPDATLGAYRGLPVHVREQTTLLFFSRREPPVVVQASVDAREAVLAPRPSRAELVQLFNIADVFVFPSWYEGFGLPPLEAMACGTPVIVSDVGSLPEIVADAGIIVGPTDYTALSEALRGLLENDPLRLELGEQALKRAAAFSWRSSVETLAGVYHDAARGRRAEREHGPRPKVRRASA